MGRGAWWVTVHEASESDTTEQLNTNTDINPSQLYSSPGAVIKNYELSYLTTEVYSLAILDAMMPKLRWAELCSFQRFWGKSPPCLFQLLVTPGSLWDHNPIWSHFQILTYIHKDQSLNIHKFWRLRHTHISFGGITIQHNICMLSCFSHVWLFVTLWTVAHQAPLSMIRFSRQEYWSGLPCRPSGDLPDPGIEPVSLTSTALAGGFFTTSTT